MSAKRATPLAAAVPAIAIALLPKCPLCLASSFALLSELGVARAAFGPLWVAMIAALVVGLALTARQAIARRRVRALGAVLAGAAIVGGARWLDASLAVTVVGVCLLLGGAVRISMRASRAPAASEAPACC